MTDEELWDGHKYTTGDVIRLTGLTNRQLDWWLKTGLIRPAYTDSPSPGSGHRLYWSSDDVRFLRQVRARLDFGLSVQAAFRPRDPSVLPDPPDRRLMPSPLRSAS